MAVISSVVIGQGRGSIGTVTLTRWKGLQVAKSKPISVAQPASDKRTMRQSALTQVVALFRLLSTVINLTFKSMAIQMSAYNAWSRLTLNDAFDYTTPPVAELVVTDLSFSKGTIADTPPIISSIVNNANQVTVTFPTTSIGAGQSATDVAVLVVYSEDNLEWKGLVSTAARSTGTVTLTGLTAMTTGSNIHIWLSFASVSTSAVSDSVYATAVVAAA